MKFLTGAFAASVLAYQPAAASAQVATFKQNIDAVRIDALVTDGRRPVGGLTAEDFAVFDNGVPQHVQFASLDQMPVNVVFALDTSGSVEGERLELFRAATRAVVERLRAGDQTALVTFDEIIRLQVPLTPDVRQLQDRLRVADGTGRTALSDAVYASVLLTELDPARSVLILLSDGLDTSSWLAQDRVLAAVKRANAVIYVVTVADNEYDDWLRQLTAATGGAVFGIASPADMGSTFVRIIDEFRSRYLLSYTPTGVDRAGWHDLRVTVKGRRASVRARPGYLAGEQ